MSVLRNGGLALALLLGLTGQARAEGHISVERAIELATERSPSVQVSRATREAVAAYAGMGQQTRVRNPNLALRALIGRPDDPAATYAATLSLPIDLSRTRGYWRREAMLLAERADAELAAAENDARAAAVRAYIETAVAQALVEVQQNRLDTIGETLGRVRAQLAASAATAYEVALAERELGEAEADFIAANAELVAAQGRLRQALDLEADESFTVSLPDAPEQMPYSLERIIALAIERRREPEARRLAAQGARMSAQRIGASVMNPVAFGLEYELQGNTQRNQSYGASVSFNVPVLFRNDGERAVAQANAQAFDVESEVLERNVAREAQTSLRQLDARIAELEALDERAVPAAERAVAATEARLAVGAVDLFQLLANRRDLFTLRARRLLVLQEAWSARVALERAIGGRGQ